ncbi:MAG: NAAT family transporter [Verrucomicrobia bacterium]|nr:NAAT family transporter [Verrucomicrobiota bacterium]
MKILAMAFSFFLLMDSIGNIPLFISILKDIPHKRQTQIILRELLIALVVMVLFNYLGDYLLNALQVTPYSVSISGGIILFLIALKMIFPVKSDSENASKGEKEPFIVPLAIPLVAGPAVLAAIILNSQQESGTIIAIFAAWIVTTLILLSSTFLNRILGQRGILACERLMGLVLTMIAIQMFLEGLGQFLTAFHAH